jgi:two-component sensor histidine kinase
MAEISDVDRLLALRATGLLDTPPEESFDRVTRLASRILEAPVALISLVDADRQFFKSQRGLPAPFDHTRQTPLSHSFCQQVVATEETLRVTDARADARVCNNLAVRDLSVIAYLGVPLAMPDGSVLGSLCAIDDKPRDWSPDDVAALKDLAHGVMDQIALRLEMGKRREAERQQKLLIAELHHRVKNTLAVVQSIVGMSVRTATSLADVRDAITARLISLANTHTLLADQEWESTSLRQLLDSELSPEVEDGRIALAGPDALLPSQCAVALGMCVHELMTNAIKYGALSVPAGRVEVDWTVAGNGARELRLRWAERGGPKVSPPERKGFGSILLDRVVRQQEAGALRLDYHPHGLFAEITMALPKADKPG